MSRRTRPGFTLVELLVVVSIIALLLAILLPSLGKAREQGKLAVCGGHLHEIATAMLMYHGEYDQFPILLTVAPPPYVGVFAFIEWSYGGWAGKNQQYLNTSNNYGLYNLPPRRRPLSPYMYGHGDLADDVILPVFRCPSDTLSLQNGRDQGLSTYDDVGTSYTMNITWFWQPKPHWDREAWREAVEQRGNAIWKRYSQKGAACFVAIAEDPFVYMIQPLNNKKPRGRTMGWHKRFSTHNLAFLDGHVAYMSVDTLRYRGSEWTVADERRVPPWTP